MNMDTKRLLLIAKVLLTIGALEFFGPIVRDTNSTHLLNPEWVGHARVHLAWCLALWAILGAFSLYLIWGRKPLNFNQLYLAWGIQTMNVLAFWIAVALVPAYDGLITDPKTHILIFGVDENVVAFTGFFLLSLSSFIVLKKLEARGEELPA